MNRYNGVKMKKQIVAVFLCSCISGFSTPEPVLDVKVDLAKWLAPTGMTNEFAQAVALMDVSKASAGLYVDDGRLIPVAKVETAMPQLAAAFLSDTNRSGMTAVSPTEFAWAPDKKMQDWLDLLSVEEPRIQTIGDALLFSGASYRELAQGLDAGLTGETTAKATLRFGNLIEPLIASANRFVAAQPDGFGKAILKAMTDSVGEMLRALKSPPDISLQIVPDGTRGRKMLLELQFPNADVAAETKSFFAEASNAWKNPAVSDRQLGIISLADTPYFQRMEQQDSMLQFNYAWPVKDDLGMLESIGKPLSSCLSDFMRSWDYPVNPEKLRATPDSSRLDAFDPGRFEKDVRQALVFDHNWKKQVSLMLDWFDPPAADLVTATLINVSVFTAEDENIVDKERPGSFMPDTRTRSARISLNTMENKPEPVKVSFTINFNLPSEVQTITLTPESPFYEKEAAGICLLGISNSVVTLRSKNMDLSTAKIYALNRRGEGLAGRSSSRSASSYRADFSGRPAAVEVLLVGDTTLCSVDVADFPVAKESKFKMPGNPTNAVPVRYTLEPVDQFVSPDVAEIAKLEVTVATNVGSRGEWQLRFPIPGKEKVDKLAIRSYLAGVDEMVNYGQGSGYSGSGGSYYWKLSNTNILKQASAIFGDLDVRLCDEVGTYTSALTSNAVPLIEGRELPKVRVEHNVVWFDYEGDFKVLAVQAFDQNGRRLKKSNMTSSNNKRRGFHFWGQPTKVTATCSLSTTNVTIPFAIELKPDALAKVAEARKKADQFDELVEELTAVQNGSRWFGNLLAANYYFSDQAGNPCAGIPLEMANADPVGADLFGYELKPYKGYFLKKVPNEYEARREQKPDSYQWSGGAFKTANYTGQLLAIPAEKALPAILVLRGDDAFVNYGDVTGIEQVPSSQRELEKAGWIRVR